MAYQFDFLAVLDYGSMLGKGAAVTLGLTAVGALCGGAIGVAGALCRVWRIRPLDTLVNIYVELIRNTPFLVQLLFIFFGLPSLGLKLTEAQASILAIVVNLGAYTTEIVRAGLEVTSRGQLEAAASLAMTRWQIFRYVVLRPALQKVWPALTSQVVIVMLGSSVCSQIALEDLTFAANFIQSRNFRAFETYFTVTAIYFLLALALRQVFKWIGQEFIAGRRTGAAR